MKLYTNGTGEKLLTDKAYNVIYKNQGYKPVEDVKGDNGEDDKGLENGEGNNIEDYTLEDFKALAKEKGIKGYSKMSKEELLEKISKEEGAE